MNKSEDGAQERGKLRVELNGVAGTYCGELAERACHGHGKWVSDDSLVEYDGSWACGLPSGYGKLASRGCKFRGHFLGGKKHGEGFFTWEDGTSYEGEWRGDCAVGAGCFIPQYVAGEWRDDAGGKGTFVFEEGGEMELSTPRGVTTELMRAARAGNAQAVGKLVRQSGLEDHIGRTALMFAAECGSVRCIKLLLCERGKRDIDGNTALMHAAKAGHAACVRVLLAEAGARNYKQQTHLMAAALKCADSCVGLLLFQAGCEDNNNRTALMQRCAMHKPIARNSPLLLEAGQLARYGLSKINSYYKYDAVFVKQLQYYKCGLCDAPEHDAFDKAVKRSPILQKRASLETLHLQKTAHLRWALRVSVLRRAAHARGLPAKLDVNQQLKRQLRFALFRNAAGVFLEVVRSRTE